MIWKKQEFLCAQRIYGVWWGVGVGGLYPLCCGVLLSYTYITGLDQSCERRIIDPSRRDDDLIYLLTTYGNKTMERFDFTDRNNIRALVDSSARAVNDQYSELRNARKDQQEGTSTKGFVYMKMRQHSEASALNYKLQAEWCLMRADEEALDATTAVHHARVNEHRACAGTYLAQAEECIAEAEKSRTEWMASTD